MGLNGKVVVITGGSGALGHTVTPACVSAGARVITVDRASPTESRRMDGAASRRDR